MEPMEGGGWRAPHALRETFQNRHGAILGLLYLCLYLSLLRERE